jgi:hypothetical protein
MTPHMMGRADVPSPVPRWVAPAFGAFALGTIIWTVYLAATLPQHAHTRHYRLAWVGFDVGLAIVLIATALLAWRGHRHVGLTAAATATILVVDAWFDVVTAPRGALTDAVLEAVFAEIPLALICLWIALHVDRVIERRLLRVGKEAAKVSAE